MDIPLFLKYIRFAILLAAPSLAHGQSNVLVVLAHPNLIHSEVNKSLAKKLSSHDIVTMDNLYEKYSDFKIDIREEQELIIAHDIVIFQFPLYWFSSPALLKKWQDEVITSKFSMGENNKLKGKKLLILVSAGGSEKDYRHGGTMAITIDEVLTPFESFAHFTEMEYLAPFVTYGVPNPKILNISMSEEQREERKKLIDSQGDKLIEFIYSISKQ